MNTAAKAEAVAEPPTAAKSKARQPAKPRAPKATVAVAETASVHSDPASPSDDRLAT